MSYRSMLAIAALLAIVISANRAQETEQAKAERYIKESESQMGGSRRPG